MRNWTGRWIIVIIMVLLDWYVFQAIKTVSQSASDRTRMVISLVYWGLSISAIIFVLLFPFMTSPQWRGFRNYAFAIVVGLFFAKFLTAVFLLIDDIRRLLIWLMAKIFPNTGARFISEENMIPRSTFLSWLGLGVGGALFTSLVYGFSNKYNYQVKRITLEFDELPASFDGLKVLQLSDIHSGSFTDKAEVNHGVEMALAENADLILFTGDLVNDRADEMTPYMDVFSKLKAPLGVFSTLGNHDYGDYVAWPSPQAKAANLDALKKVHGKLGWRLLMNEHQLIEKNGEQIAVIGIENWSAKGRFPKYGKMPQAYAGTENVPFKILLSHDPSHWDAEVIPKYPDVDLMLAGHTHGMQFGVELPFLKWSPVQYVYKQWAGLYEEKKQKLYVNRGYGFIGYPGRVGILPEITVFTLKRK
jgi:predicted MPP superfamily phosphohydrolase